MIMTEELQKKLTEQLNCYNLPAKTTKDYPQ